MKCKVTCDAFIHGNNHLQEDYSGGAWSYGDISHDDFEKGVMFPPETNLSFGEFMEEKGKGLLYAITHIDKEGCQHGYIDLTHQQALDFILQNSDNVINGNMSYLNVYRMYHGMNMGRYCAMLWEGRK